MPKKNRSSKRKIKKFAYIQNWGTYSNQTIVSVGMNHSDMVAYLRKIKAKILILNNFLNNQSVIRIIEEKVDGLVHKDYQSGVSILMFPNWKNDWKHWDCLIHEVSHLIFFVLGEQKNMANEDEARAYQTEFLFREIRRKLFKNNA